MNLFEPFDGGVEICTSGKAILLKSKIPIPRCWIKISNPAGKIVFKTIEKDLTETTIDVNLKGGFYLLPSLPKKALQLRRFS